MTKTRIVALLSVLALLASLPLSVALGQGGQAPDFRVVGNVEVDGEQAAEGLMVVAMVDGEKAGEGMVDAMGGYEIEVMGAMGAMISFTVVMEVPDGEAMMYEAMSEDEAMVGESFGVEIVDLMAFTEGAPDPTATPAPTKSADEELTAAVNAAVAAAIRSVRAPTGVPGEPGEPGTMGVPGDKGEPGDKGDRGNRGITGSPGDKGDQGDQGPQGAAGATGGQGPQGDAGAQGEPGAPGASGNAGPQGEVGNAGAAGADGEAGEAGGGGILAIIALIIAIVGVVAAGGAFIAGRQGGG